MLWHHESLLVPACQPWSTEADHCCSHAHFSSQHLLRRTEKQLYFLKDKSWEEVRSGIFEKVDALDKLKLDGVLPMIGLRMDCCLGNRAEVVPTPVDLSSLDNTLTGNIIYYE